MKIDETEKHELTALPSYEKFVDNCNSRFMVLLPNGKEFELLLNEITEKKTSKYQVQFSLIFRGQPEEFLPQSIYSLKHNALGNFDLFLVPVGKDEAGFLYESVFNNLLQNDK